MVAYLKKPTRSEGFQEIVDFLNGSHIWYAITKNPTIYVSLIEKFWQTATVKTVDNGEQEITATVDGKEFTITEASDDRVERATTTAASLDAEQASGNITRTQSTKMLNVPLPQGIGAGGSPRCQEAMRGSIAQTRSYFDAAKENVHTYTRRRAVSTASRISTAEESVSTAGALMPVSTAEQTKTKLQQRQERAGYEAAVRLQEQLDEEERKRIARVHEEASSFNIEEWEDIQATIEADEELAQRIQVEEREKYSKAKKARLLAELINQRKRYFAPQRAEERRNKPLTQA
ncbi:hypothetical protein Tco_0331664 [Tanacetum coccineum]